MGTDWSILENVRAEWPADDLEPKADLDSWREGMRLYDARDDYASMVESGRLMCRALRHHLYGRGILVDADLPETTHRVLFSSCFPPPDQRTFPQSVQAQVRLGLTIVKKEGWQPVPYGGNGAMAKFIDASVMVMGMALSPSSDRPWEGDLRQFFTTNPVEITAADAVPAQAAVPGRRALNAEDTRLVDDLYEMTKAAEAGDLAAAARMRGILAREGGETEEALRELEAAARMGDLGAMFEAGSAADDLGQKARAQYWYDAAADRGHPTAAFNVGVVAKETGDLASARRRFEQAATNGSIEAYAALTQIADETGDRDAELRWSRLGADQGHPFCQTRHAQLLMQDHPADRDVIFGRAVPLLKLAAEQGATGAAFLFGIGYGQIGDASNARLWLKQAEAEGDADATRVIREHGFE
jgi:TPR repeat protein